MTEHSVRDACEAAGRDIRDDGSVDLQLAQTGSVDRGEEIGKTADHQLELAAAKRRIRQLEIELAVASKINEVFLREGITPKRGSGRVGERRPVPRGVAD